MQQQVIDLAEVLYVNTLNSSQFIDDYRIQYEDAAANAFHAAKKFYEIAANEGKALNQEEDPCEGCTGCDAQQEALSHIQRIIQQKYSEAAARNSEALQDILMKSLQKAMGK
jgi:hypothetical protein